MRRIVVALAAALLPARIHGQGASSMHPIDFDGDGDIDIVKSSPIGIVWLENHGARAGAPENNTRRLFRTAGVAAAASYVMARGRAQILTRRAPPQVDKEWETHIISLNQNIKDAVAAHKRHRRFVGVMEGRGVAPVSALSDEPPVLVAGEEDVVQVDVAGDVVGEKARYAEQEL